MMRGASQSGKYQGSVLMKNQPNRQAKSLSSHHEHPTMPMRISSLLSLEVSHHDDNDNVFTYYVGGRRRRDREEGGRRRTYSRDQQMQLMQLFHKTQYPTTAEKDHLAKSLGVTRWNIQIWFQNKRDKSSKSKKRKMFCKMAASGFGPIGKKKGALVTCEQHAPEKAHNEIFKLLNLMLEEYYPDLDKEEESKEDSEDTGSSTTIMDDMQKELMDLREDFKKRKEMFKVHDVGVKGIFFVSINHSGIDAIDLISKLYNHVRDNQMTIRWLHKVIPVQKTTPAKEEDILSQIKEVTAPIFNIEGQPGKKWSVQYNCRNNQSVDRITILQEAAKLVHLKNYVDLKDPDWAVIVEVCKTNAFVTVTNQWKEYHKYNLRMMLNGEKERAAKQSQQSRDDLRKDQEKKEKKEEEKKEEKKEEEETKESETKKAKTETE
ncbi:hypothetical protein PROFUN_06124 [Planoprotostelium fungivorum]|uniref:Homeobox domain-containing protein n=1 Tax=Planoprotostelium fungivorum TaxID=1890364 RepID=A0A2P6NPG0_9EUKA|nr:hypothetical protein PROFUN_06124 [Planoprotostelium fungivorum]